MDVGDQPAVESRLQAFFHALEIGGRFVRRDHDLAALVDQGVEGVEEFLLGRLLAADELDVVDHQNLDRAELFLEIHRIVLAQRPDEPVHELLGRKVDDGALGIALADVPGDGVHEVGLAEPDAAIEEKRVEGRRLSFGDAPRRGIGELVGLADDEAVEGAARIERRADLLGVGECRDGGRGAADARTGGRRLFGFGRGRIIHVFGRCRIVRQDEDVDGAHRRLFAQPQILEALGVMGHHPVPHETGGNRNADHAVEDLANGHRFQPALESGFADLGSNTAADPFPLRMQAAVTGVVCHPRSPRRGFHEPARLDKKLLPPRLKLRPKPNTPSGTATSASWKRRERLSERSAPTPLVFVLAKFAPSTGSSAYRFLETKHSIPGDRPPP